MIKLYKEEKRGFKVSVLGNETYYKTETECGKKSIIDIADSSILRSQFCGFNGFK